MLSDLCKTYRYCTSVHRSLARTHRRRCQVMDWRRYREHTRLFRIRIHWHLSKKQSQIVSMQCKQHVILAPQSVCHKHVKKKSSVEFLLEICQLKCTNASNTNIVLSSGDILQTSCSVIISHTLQNCLTTQRQSVIASFFFFCRQLWPKLSNWHSTFSSLY